jgi:hypothetical protein
MGHFGEDKKRFEEKLELDRIAKTKPQTLRKVTEK